MNETLSGKVAWVAGATRGAGRGIATALGEAGATVYCTGRTTRDARSEYDRPETIEETAEAVSAAGGKGIAIRADHLEPDEVRAVAERIDREHGRLDVLVNDIWGGELLFEWDTPLWRPVTPLLFMSVRPTVYSHLTTSHFALPRQIRRSGVTVVERADGTRDYNEDRYRFTAYYNHAKTSVIRLAFAKAAELAPNG